MENLEPGREFFGRLALTRCGTDLQTTENEKSENKLSQIRTTYTLGQTVFILCFSGHFWLLVKVRIWNKNKFHF